MFNDEQNALNNPIQKNHCEIFVCEDFSSESQAAVQRTVTASLEKHSPNGQNQQQEATGDFQIHGESVELHKVFEQVHTQMENTATGGPDESRKQYNRRISSQNISCTITTYEKPTVGSLTADNILQYELRLREAQRTVSNRDILIKMLHDQLKRFEDLYRKTIDENREVRLKYCHTVQELGILKKKVEECSKEERPKEDDEKNFKCIESLIEKQTDLLQKLAQEMSHDSNSKNSFNQEEETKREKLISSYEYSVAKTNYDQGQDNSSNSCCNKIKSLDILEELQCTKYLSNSIATNVAMLSKNYKEISEKVIGLEAEIVELKSKIKSNEELKEKVIKLESQAQYEQKLQELNKKIDEITKINVKLSEENEKLKTIPTPMVTRQDQGDINPYTKREAQTYYYTPPNLTATRSKSDHLVHNTSRHRRPQKYTQTGCYAVNLDQSNPITSPKQQKGKVPVEDEETTKLTKCKNGDTLKLSQLQKQRNGVSAECITKQQLDTIDKNDHRQIDGVPLKIYLNNLHEQLKVFNNIETAIEVLRKDLVGKLK